MYRENFNHRTSKPVWILCHNSMKFLAKEIVRCCLEWQKKAVKEWNAHDIRKIEYKDIIQWDTFLDGFPNLFIKDVKEMAGKDIIFLSSMHSVDILFEQLSMMYQLPRYLAHSVTVIIPYFPTGTMERVDLEGQIATARTLAQQVSLIPLTARGPCQIMIYDIHALQERFYFSNTVIPRMETAIPLLIKELEIRFNANELSNLMISYPDEGAQKRFGRFFTQWPEIICSKTRVGAKREIRIRDGDPKGKHVVIVDDLVQTGGTLIEAMKVLYSSGAIAVSAYVTHAVFPNSSWRRFIAAENEGKPLLANFWFTDSIPHAVEIAEHPPFKLLSLAPVIADSLLGFELRQWDH